jgi:hypothetical protein
MKKFVCPDFRQKSLIMYVFEGYCVRNLTVAKVDMGFFIMDYQGRYRVVY